MIFECTTNLNSVSNSLRVVNRIPKFIPRTRENCESRDYGLDKSTSTHSLAYLPRSC